MTNPLFPRNHKRDLKKGMKCMEGRGSSKIIVGAKNGLASVTDGVIHAQTFKSLGYPAFRLFFYAMLGHMMSTNMQILVRSLLIYRLTGSAAILGAMSFAHFLPLVFVSPFGGAIADRFQKKRIILFGELILAFVALSVGLSLSLGYLKAEHSYSIWILVAASILQGSAVGLTMPSRHSILPEIVGKEHLMNAISLNTMCMNVMRLLAPAAAGFLVDSIGFHAVYFTMAGMYSMAIVFIAFLPLTSVITKHAKSAFAEIKEGVHYIRHDKTILLILVFAFFGVVLSLPYMTLMPIFADDILKVGATGLGILISVSGIGAVAGSLILASLPNKRRGLLFLISNLTMGLTLLIFSFSTIWSLSLILMSFVGLAHASRMTLSNIMLQYYAAVEYRGRVMSVYAMEIGLISLGTFFAGLLTEAIGVQWALGIFSLLLAFISLGAIIFAPHLRKLK